MYSVVWDFADQQAKITAIKQTLWQDSQSRLIHTLSAFRMYSELYFPHIVTLQPRSKMD